MEKKIRNCVVCEREIEITKERMGKSAHSNYPNSHNLKSHTSNLTSSKDGIICLKKWFCNDCWKKIMDYAKNVAKVIR